jgi:hypothetical protein
MRTLAASSILAVEVASPLRDEKSVRIAITSSIRPLDPHMKRVMCMLGLALALAAAGCSSDTQGNGEDETAAGTGAFGGSGGSVGAGGEGAAGGAGGAGGMEDPDADPAPSELNNAHGRMNGPSYTLQFQLGRTLHQRSGTSATHDLICAAPSHTKE